MITNVKALFVAAVALAAAQPAIAQPANPTETAVCYIQETAYYRSRILNELGIKRTDLASENYLTSNTLMNNMMNAVAAAVAQKCGPK